MCRLLPILNPLCDAMTSAHWDHRQVCIKIIAVCCVTDADLHSCMHVSKKAPNQNLYVAICTTARTQLDYVKDERCKGIERWSELLVSSALYNKTQELKKELESS